MKAKDNRLADSVASAEIKKNQMKIAEIGDYVADNGDRNNTSMTVDIGN